MLQGKGVNGSEDNFMAKFEGERRRVDEARLALVEEKARIAKLLEQQGERLQQEVPSMCPAVWRLFWPESLPTRLDWSIPASVFWLLSRSSPPLTYQSRAELQSWFAGVRSGAGQVGV